MEFSFLYLVFVVLVVYKVLLHVLCLSCSFNIVLALDWLQLIFVMALEDDKLCGINVHVRSSIYLVLTSHNGPFLGWNVHYWHDGFNLLLFCAHFCLPSCWYSWAWIRQDFDYLGKCWFLELLDSLFLLCWFMEIWRNIEDSTSLTSILL